MKAKKTPTPLVAAAVAVSFLLWAQSANAQYTLIDNFESYTVGAHNGGSTAFTPSGGPWATHDGGGTSIVQIESEIDNQYLGMGWDSGIRAANRALDAANSLAEGASGTYFFDFRSAGTDIDFSFGLSAQTDTIDNWDDFEAYVALVDDGAGSIRLYSRNGGTTTEIETGLSDGVWYNIWLVVDNAADTYDVYYGTGLTQDDIGSATLVADDFAFRNGTASALGRIGGYGWNTTGDGAEFDNIYTNVNIPEPGTYAMLAGLTALGFAALRRRKK